MHVHRLPSPVVGRRIDRLREDPLAEPAVKALGDVLVVFADRAPEGVDGHVHGPCHLFDRVRAAHRAVGELEAERPALSRAAVRDHPARAAGLRQNGLADVVDGHRLVHEALARAVDIDVPAHVVEKTPARVGQQDDVAHPDRVAAHHGAQVEPIARGTVEIKSLRIGRGRHVDRETIVIEQAPAHVGREATRGDHDATRAEHLVPHFAAGKRALYHNPDESVLLGPAEPHGARVERRRHAEHSCVLVKRDHEAAASGKTERRHASRMHVAHGLIGGARHDETEPLEPVDGRLGLGRNAGDVRSQDRAARLDRVLDPELHGVREADGRLTPRTQHGDGARRIERVPAHERPLFKKQHAHGTRLSGGDRGREAGHARADHDHVPVLLQVLPVAGKRVRGAERRCGACHQQPAPQAVGAFLALAAGERHDRILSPCSCPRPFRRRRSSRASSRPQGRS